VVALWYLLLLAPFVALAVLWLNYRRRQAARERESIQRWQRVGEARPAMSGEPSVAAPATAAHRLRPRLLEPADTMLFRLLALSLSDHDVFAGVSVDQILVPGTSLTGLEREARLRAWSRMRIDFLVCDKGLQPCVAVLVDAVDERMALVEVLRASGLRCVTLTRSSLPGRHQMRAVVLGEGTPAASRSSPDSSPYS